MVRSDTDIMIFGCLFSYAEYKLRYAKWVC